MRRFVTKVRVAAAVLVLVALATGYSTYRWYQAHQLAQANSGALAAARQFSIDFMSVNAKSVDQDMARVQLGATGEFGDEYKNGMPKVRQAVVENNVEQSATVLRAALVNGDKDSAIVLVAIDATIKNVKTPEGRTAHYRVQLDLVLEEGSDRWRVSKLQFVG